ncbi:MAG: MFS transporter [Chloroflexi bacterium]|nr:MAG: MFS transporter [Chloroflexota bacterium]
MNWKKVAQLSLVHVGVSITVVPVTSTLNRIMIADMNLSALFVGVLVALPYLLSPLQVVIGHWADRHPLWGRHRTPWVVVGGLMAAFGSYLTPHAVYLLEHNYALGLLAAVGSFVVWGMGVNIASVSYLSLVSELTDENSNWRSRAVSVMWTAMILSTIVTAIGLSSLLEPYSEAALYTAFGAVWLVACFCVLVGSAGLEPPATANRQVQHRADNPLVAFRVLAHNPTAHRFFVYLLVVLVSIHAQDVLLEPFGAEALALPVAMTSRLTSIWGVGLFLTLIGGLPLVRRWGKKPSAHVGALVTALAFALIIATGVAGQPSLFMASVFLLGLGGGLMTVSNLSFMLDMTVPQAAGLYMGAWGVANFTGQAVGNIVSGLVRDLLYWLTGSAILGYVVVFGLEVLGLLAAVWLLRTISVEEFRRAAEVRLADVVALAAD